MVLCRWDAAVTTAASVVVVTASHYPFLQSTFRVRKADFELVGADSTLDRR
ncbi:hypothetical protein F4825DRAFT_458601 [Nemania diffusa]|nr:hypothetical protein F4825DRAFT_458601 [Nemania diffusa]